MGVPKYVAQSQIDASPRWKRRVQRHISLPISPADADDLMDDIQAKAILNGVRGTPPVDRQKVKTLMLRLSDIAMAHPELRSSKLI
jgi:hypothetical protein